MAISRFSRIAGAMLLLAIAQPAWSQAPDCCSEISMKGGAVRKTYSLAEVSEDPALGAWIAELIPQVVQPGTWNTGDPQNRHVLSYYAPGKMLLVYHTPAAHSEIDDFLRGVKKSLPSKTTAATAAKAPALFGLAQTQYTVPEPHPEPMSGPAGYPVPAQPQQSKHLFHFIIRYEGVGVIDRNVVDFAKQYATSSEVKTPPSPTPMPPATELPPCNDAKDGAQKPVKLTAPAPCAPCVPLTSAELSIPAAGHVIPASGTLPAATPATAPRPVAPPEPIEESRSGKPPLPR